MTSGKHIEKPCIICGKLSKNPKYCSIKCHGKYRWNKWKEEYEKNGFIKGCKNENMRIQQRKYLLEKRGHKCEICNGLEWMGQKIPLVLDHIDGNSDNGAITNLRLVCGNCDMQLPTYKGKNFGHGRASRRKRYAEGKSY
jgi:hypothetical protein